MISIYSCKMFRSSSRKDEIVSAIQNPLNTELVQQLKEYVDIPDQVEEQPKPNSRKISRTVEVEPAEKRGFEPSSDPYIPSGGPSFSERPLDTFEDEEPQNDSDTIIDKPVEKEVKPDSTDTEVESCTITATTSLPEQLKGTLNIDSDTSGVTRVVTKGREMWVYYNDNINLNNVMTDVLDKLAAANFSTLSFSRLARSDNAIVFDILETSQPLEVTDNGDAKET